MYVHKKGSDEYRKIEREALHLGAKKFGISRKGNFKYYIVYKARTIHFGDKRYEDFTWHKDPKRQKRYRDRHRAILKKDGTPAYLDKNQASYWSYWISW